MRLSLSATSPSGDSNRRFRNRWIDGQTEFTLTISPNVAVDDVAQHAVTDDDEIKEPSLS